MYDYQFPAWLPISFFVILLVLAFLVGKWLVKKERNYKGF